MRFLYSIVALVLVTCLASCGKQVNISTQDWDETESKNESFDSPALIKVENNISLPESSLWDD